jgi:3-deoxy-D-manno-octulosonic-acid transferase
MLRLYNTLLLLLRPLAALWYLRHRGSSQRGVEAAERMARRLPTARSGGLWVHGSSMGEARIVNALARAVRVRAPERAISLSAYTRTGRAQLPDGPPADASFYLPLDFSGFPRRVLHRLKPDLLVIVETELWPNLLNEAHRSGTAVAVINARLAPERMTRYRRLAGLYRPLLTRLSRVGAQSDDDAARFLELGLPEAAVRVTGNVKYDLPAPAVDEEALRREIGLEPGRPVLVAGSTGEGEEEQVLEAFAELRSAHPDLFLILAPRHPERADDVERLVRSRGHRLRRLSGGPAGPGQADLLLVDALGRLGALYGLGSVAFVGGSLVPVGGHNVLEPAALGVPVLFGPHTHHFAEPAGALLRAGGGFRVRDAAALARESSVLLADDELRTRAARAARGVVEENRGAMARSVDLVFEALEASGAGEREGSP